MRFDNIRCIKMLILNRQMKTHFSKEAAERMGLAWEMSVKAMAKKKRTSIYTSPNISMSWSILFKHSKVLVVYEKMKSMRRRTSQCVKKIVDSDYICNHSTSRSYPCKSLWSNSFLVINLMDRMTWMGRNGLKDEHTRLIQHNAHHIILIKHENKMKRDSILWKNQETTKKMTNTTWTAVFVELE